MAVLVEAISVVVRRDAIDRKYQGGWEAFIQAVPNATMCADDDIVLVGFMTPQDVQSFVAELEHRGLRFLYGTTAVDMAVVDQQLGLTAQCDWLEFGRVRFGNEGGMVSACWFFAGPRIASGVHVRGIPMQLATPRDWQFDGSLSQRFKFVPSGQQGANLKFLRNEDGVGVFLDLTTGKEVYIAHPTTPAPGSPLSTPRPKSKGTSADPGHP